MRNSTMRALMAFAMMFASLSWVLAQERTVSGKISDENGDPLPGVSISIKGTTTGTVSGVDGGYAVQVPGNSAVLVVSFIGYVAQEITVGSQSSINVAMEPDVLSLSEVVVVGYGEQKKATVTGSVVSVSGADIKKAPATNVSNTLVGRMPGLTLVNSSGEPGNDGSSIRIRGINTLNNSSALIVIDGIANRNGGLDRLNPNDIESITVLKDASAAIYGAQAANGVILVTTRRGKTGKPTVDFSYNQGFNKPTRLPEVADAALYATMLNEVDEYRNQTPRFSSADIQKYQDGSSPWTHPNTDWYADVIKPVSLQNNANLSLSGGTEDVKYFVSVGKLFEDGYYKESATFYKQYNFRTNIDAQVTDFLKVSLDIYGRKENRNFPTRGAGSIFRSLIRGKPNLPGYWPNGLPAPDIENGDNPVVTSTNATGYVLDNKYALQSNLGFTIDVPGVEGLSFVTNLAVDEMFRPVKNWQTPWYLYTADFNNMVGNEPTLIRSQRGLSAPQLTESFGSESGFTANARFLYTKEIEDHSLSFMIGSERQVIEGKYFDAFRNNYNSTAIDQLFAGADNNSKTNNGSAWVAARLNYFGRINYVYSEKYLAEVVWRYDGSQIFDEDYRYGFFPGLSLGWLLSEESFMQGNSFFNRLKLRASYGTMGNDRIAQYQYLASFGFGESYIFGLTNETKSIRPTSVPNKGVSWEVAKNMNVGVDGVALDGAINFELDYFINNRTGILIQRNASIPFTAGFTPPDENIGEVSNKGFDFRVDYSAEAGDVKYSIGLNGGYAKNKIVFWDEPATGVEEWQRTTGRPIASDLYYDAIGVFETQADVDAYPHWGGARPGDIIFRDVNGDNAITTADRIREPYNIWPKFTAGINFGVQYKNFDFTMLIQGASGAKRYIQTQSGDFGNYLMDFAEGRWTTANPSSEKPRSFNRTDEYWIAQRNNYWYRSTDYIRLKNLQIAYNVPANAVEKLGLQGIQIYTNGLNLITIDKFKVYDPENDNQSGSYYPQKLVINFGANLTF